MILVKLLYYAGLCFFSLAGGFYFLATLFHLIADMYPSKVRENVILLIALLVTLACLYVAFRFGHQNGQWGAGLGMVIASVVVFLVVFVGGMSLFGRIHWQ